MKVETISMKDMLLLNDLITEFYIVIMWIQNNSITSP